MFIETERLTLSPILEADAEALHQIWTQPLVRQYLWDDRAIDFAETQEIVHRNQIAFSQSLYGLWGTRLLAEKDLIGFCGYWPFFDPPEVQLIYGLSSDYWGRGFAVEMARAMVKYGLESLNFSTIFASADAPNKRSIAVMERLAMTCYKRQEMEGKETLFYKLDREDFVAPHFTFKLEK